MELSRQRRDLRPAAFENYSGKKEKGKWRGGGMRKAKSINPQFNFSPDTPVSRVVSG